MEADYSNREIDLKIGELRTLLIAIHDDVKEVKTQTTKTNGRVTALETREAQQMGRMWGIGATVGLVWTVITTLWLKK